MLEKTNKSDVRVTSTDPRHHDLAENSCNRFNFTGEVGQGKRRREGKGKTDDSSKDKDEQEPKGLKLTAIPKRREGVLNDSTDSEITS